MSRRLRHRLRLVGYLEAFASGDPDVVAGWSPTTSSTSTPPHWARDASAIDEYRAATAGIPGVDARAQVRGRRRRRRGRPRMRRVHAAHDGQRSSDRRPRCDAVRRPRRADLAPNGLLGQLRVSSSRRGWHDPCSTATLGVSGIEVSTLALGTMMFGAWGNPDEAACTRMVERCAGRRRHDVRHRGHLRLRPIRGDPREALRGTTAIGIVLATKVGNAMSDDPQRRGLSRALDRPIVRGQPAPPAGPTTSTCTRCIDPIPTRRSTRRWRRSTT